MLYDNDHCSLMPPLNMVSSQLDSQISIRKCKDWELCTSSNIRMKTTDAPVSATNLTLMPAISLHEKYWLLDLGTIKIKVTSAILINSSSVAVPEKAY